MGYELRVVSNSNTWIVPFETISLTEELNLGLSGTLTLNYQALDRYAKIFSLTPDSIFGAAYTEWFLYRAGVLFRAGILAHRKISGTKQQGTSYTVNMLGFEYLLKNRLTGNAGVWAYLATDKANIAWDLINRTQSDAGGHGNVGITRGTHPATSNSDQTNRYNSILDCIIGLSNQKKSDGYDWEITPQKVFNIYYPAKGSTLANIVIDDFNILSWSSDRDLTVNLANRVIGVGAGFDDAINTVTVEDTTAQTAWYLQEQTCSAKDITLTGNLTVEATALLNDKKTPLDVVSLQVNDRSPDISTYNLGDTLPVKISAINFSKNLRVIKRTMQIARSGEAQVNLSFDYAA